MSTDAARALVHLSEAQRKAVLNLAALRPDEWRQRRALKKQTVRALIMRGLITAKDVGLVPCMRLTPHGEAVAAMLAEKQP